MNEAAQALREWDSFFVIVGSSAGALTGLQFVVLTLIASSPRTLGSGESVAAFGSPNVVHFCAALLVSAIFSAPWHGLAPAGVATSVIGVLGVAYSLIVLRRAMRQKDYEPVLEDWIWHAVLPTVTYARLFTPDSRCATSLRTRSTWSAPRRCSCCSSASTTPGTP